VVGSVHNCRWVECNTQHI